MKAWNYNLKADSDTIISWIITLMIITILYLLMINVHLPESEPPKQVVIDQIIDTRSIIKKVRDARKKEKDHLTSDPNKKKKMEPKKSKVLRPSNKIEISEIIKKNPNITKKTNVSTKLREKIASNHQKTKMPELNRSRSGSALKKALELKNTRYTNRGTELPLTRKTGTDNFSKLVAQEDTSGGTHKYKYSNGQEDISAAPEGRGGDDWPIFQLGYAPGGSKVKYELSEVIRWIVAHHNDLPGGVNKNLRKKKDDKTAKVQFQINDTKYTMFLRATPTVGAQELAFAICHDDEVALLIDQGADQKDDKLQTGKLFRNSKGEIVNFLTSGESFDFEKSGNYSRIFWTWWENKKKTTKK